MHTSALPEPPSASDLLRPLNADLSGDVFRRALHAANNLVVITDPNLPDNPIVWVNDQFCAFTGYAREEVIGRNCRFLQGDDRQQHARQVLRERIDAGGFVNVVLRNYKRDGTLFYNDLYVSPVYDGDGALAYFLGVQNDATAREEALRTVRERDQQLHDLTETERERFGMELHESLGQVLTGAALSISAHLRELERAAPDLVPSARAIRDLVERALTETRQIAEGLHPLLDGEAGLQRALRDLTASMDEVSGAASTRVEAAIDDVIVADARTTRHLFRIAQEAVTNALKHAGASLITIRLYAEDGGAEDDAIVLEVEDDGCGLPASLLADDHAIPPGMRVSEVAGLAQHGRGLYSMRLRADQLGAALDVSDRPDGGTRVRCRVPTA